MMKKDKQAMEDKLRPEYELKSLKVRRLGSGRKSFGNDIVRLEPDVAEIFPNAEAVNEALRFLIRVTRGNQQTEPTNQSHSLSETINELHQ